MLAFFQCYATIQLLNYFTQKKYAILGEKMDYVVRDDAHVENVRDDRISTGEGNLEYLSMFTPPWKSLKRWRRLQAA